MPSLLHLNNDTIFNESIYSQHDNFAKSKKNRWGRTVLLIS